MLTKRTQQTIKLLHDLAFCHPLVLENEPACTEEQLLLLGKLADAGIVKLSSGGNPLRLSSYELCCDLSDISLYRLLLAINESVNVIPPDTTENRIYSTYHYGAGAIKLGVINQMMRSMLCEIDMLDL